MPPRQPCKTRDCWQRKAREARSIVRELQAATERADAAVSELEQAKRMIEIHRRILEFHSAAPASRIEELGRAIHEQREPRPRRRGEEE